MLSIEINTREKEQSILLKGQLKGMEALEFRQKVESLIEKGTDLISLDLRKVDQLDLTGFNAIVVFKKLVEKRGLRFQLLATKENSIMEYIHLSKLDLNLTQVNN